MKLIILLFLISGEALAQFSYIPHARTLEKSGIEYDLGLDYFQSTAVVTETGEALNFTAEGSYQTIDSNLNIKYAFTDEFELRVGMNIRMIKATDKLSGGTLTFDRVGAESAVVGFKFGFKETDKVKFALEGWYKNALFANKEIARTEMDPEEVSLGDDTREIAAGFSSYLRTQANNFLSARVIYRDPAQGMSSEILGEFEGVIAWEYFAFILGFEHVYSLASDTYSGDIENKPYYYNGQSERFNSVNRSWSAPYVAGNIALGKSWRIEGRYAQVMTGTSTDLGSSISFHLIKRKESKKEFAKRDSQFKEYTIEGGVTKISKKRTACVVDKGLISGLKQGMRVDFYHFDYVEGNQLIAYGVVVKAGASKSMVKIKKRYSKKRVEEGTVMRAGMLKPE